MIFINRDKEIFNSWYEEQKEFVDHDGVARFEDLTIVKDEHDGLYYLGQTTTDDDGHLWSMDIRDHGFRTLAEAYLEMISEVSHKNRNVGLLKKISNKLRGFTACFRGVSRTTLGHDTFADYLKERKRKEEWLLAMSTGKE